MASASEGNWRAPIELIMSALLLAVSMAPMRSAENGEKPKVARYGIGVYAMS